MGFTGLNIKGLLGASVITLSDNMTLQEKDRAFVLIVQATASDKTLTLDLPGDACCIVANVSNIAFIAKNVSGDAGKSIGANSINLAIVADNGSLAVFPMTGGETPK